MAPVSRQATGCLGEKSRSARYDPNKRFYDRVLELLDVNLEDDQRTRGKSTEMIANDFVTGSPHHNLCLLVRETMRQDLVTTFVAAVEGGIFGCQVFSVSQKCYISAWLVFSLRSQYLRIRDAHMSVRFGDGLRLLHVA